MSLNSKPVKAAHLRIGVRLLRLLRRLRGHNPDKGPEKQDQTPNDERDEPVDLLLYPAEGGEPLVDAEAKEDDEAVEDEPGHEEGAAPLGAGAPHDEEQVDHDPGDDEGGDGGLGTEERSMYEYCMTLGRARFHLILISRVSAPGGFSLI